MLAAGRTPPFSFPSHRHSRRDYSSFHPFCSSYLEDEKRANLFPETGHLSTEAPTEKDALAAHISVDSAPKGTGNNKEGEFHWEPEHGEIAYEELQLKTDRRAQCIPHKCQSYDKSWGCRDEASRVAFSAKYVFQDPFLEADNPRSGPPSGMDKNRPAIAITEAFAFDNAELGWKADIGLGEVSPCSDSVGMLANNNINIAPSWAASSSDTTALMGSPDCKHSLSEPCSVLDLVVSPDINHRSSHAVQPEFCDFSGDAPLHQMVRKGLWVNENWQTEQFAVTQSFTLSPVMILPKHHVSTTLNESNEWVDSILSEPAIRSHADGFPIEEEHTSHEPFSRFEHHQSERHQHSIRSDDILLSQTDSGDEKFSDELARVVRTSIVSCDEGSRSIYKAAIEEGVQLTDLLVACVDAISSRNVTFINHLLARLGKLASPEGTSMQRVAAYFSEGLACKISAMWPQIYEPLPYDLDKGAEELTSAFQVLNHATPFVKFAHYTANDIIVQAFEGEERVHVIDFDIKQGLQWPALFQSLANRSGGPPSHVRITGVGDCKDDLQDTGDRLAEFAEAAGLPFEFHPVVDKLDDLRLWMLHVKDKEAVAVNCLFQLHKTLYSRTASRNFLGLLRSVGPKVVALIEQEADHNHPSFEARFVESLRYYSALFDALDASLPPDSPARIKVERFFAHEIRNILACEGAERTERHEKEEKWQHTMEQGGFRRVFLTERAVLQARLLLGMFSCKNYRVRKAGEALIFGWLEQPLLSASAWALK